MRMVIGLVLCVSALAVTAYGFVRLALVLDSGGYGTSAVRDALIVLGGAGAMLATGIATVIWDISKRYENPSGSAHKP